MTEQPQSTAPDTGATDEPLRYEDSKGRLVPAHLVKPVDLLEDQLVSRLVDRAESLSGMLRAFKTETFADVHAFLVLLADQYGAKRGGKRGNLTFSTYNGRRKVQVAVADRLTFGAELQIAKALIDECIGDWSEGANANIRVLVDHAFRVDKEGQVSRDSVFALRHVAIEDPRWLRAMEAIADSIQVDGTKTYVRFYRRKSPESRWEAIPLDLANA